MSRHIKDDDGRRRPYSVNSITIPQRSPSSFSRLLSQFFFLFLRGPISSLLGNRKENKRCRPFFDRPMDRKCFTSTDSALTPLWTRPAAGRPILFIISIIIIITIFFFLGVRQHFDVFLFSDHNFFLIFHLNFKRVS